VLLGAADLVDRTMRDGEVDLVRRRAGLLGTETKVTEQRLGHSVMPLILLERAAPPVGESALPTESRDQAELFQRAEVGERRRWPHMKPRRDLLEARPTQFVLAGSDDAQGLDLTMRQLLECLHGSNEGFEGIYGLS